MHELTKDLYRAKEKCKAKPTENESTPQRNKIYFMNMGLVKHFFRVKAS
jgi:hypothetical protein